MQAANGGVWQEDAARVGQEPTARKVLGASQEAPTGPAPGTRVTGAELLSESRQLDLGESSGPREAMVSSSCGECEGHVDETACPSQLLALGCTDLLHELSNLLTAVLVNAQVLGWKLPPYSHLKRPVREVERSAQRAGELLKRLRQRCPQAADPAVLSCGPASFAAERLQSAGATCAAGSEPAGATDSACNSLKTRSAGRLQEVAPDLTAYCDECTSAIFPKRDDRDGARRIQRGRRWQLSAGRDE